MMYHARAQLSLERRGFAACAAADLAASNPVKEFYATVVPWLPLGSGSSVIWCVADRREAEQPELWLRQLQLVMQWMGRQPSYGRSSCPCSD
mmetsp:Transcript_28773/g.77530  ORF Transcript_28773/g.77530 Transcript_28773/m.77530 type:complete len:92 (+) Transcript_28773:465-740(+)|eukprot:1161909-Pelagomonas_calceolata.AAC.1